MNIDGDKIWTAIFGSIVGGGWWLIRRVLTNDKKIAVLENALKERDIRRDEDRQRLEGSIATIQQDVKRLLEKKS